MEHAHITWSQIGQMTSHAFMQAIDGNVAPLHQLIKCTKDIQRQSPLLAEVFGKEVVFQWNKKQVTYFLKSNIIIDLPAMGKSPSVWILTWLEQAMRSVKKISMDDLRRYHFEDFYFATQKLCAIFDYIYDTADHKSQKIIKSSLDLIPAAYNTASIKHKVQNNLVSLIFHCALLKVFGSLMLKSQVREVMKNIVECYYGKHLRVSSALFAPVNMPQADNFHLRHQDKFYWLFLKSIAPKDFEQCFVGMVNSCHKNSLAKEILASNNALLHNEKLPLYEKITELKVIDI